MATTKTQKNELMEVSYTLANGDSINLNADTVKNYLTKGNGKVTDQEIIFFINRCKSNKLNPFEDAYLTKFSDHDPATMVLAKEAYMKRAESNPNYQGMKSGIYVQNAKQNIEKREGAFSLPNESVVGGWAQVLVKDKEPSFVSVSMDEYVKKTKDGRPNAFWASKPATMIRKVAMVQALREAFPSSLGGMFIEEEVDKNNTTTEDINDQPEPKAYDLSGMNEIHEEAEQPVETEQEEFFEEYPEMETEEYEEDSDSVEEFKIPYSEYANNKKSYEKIEYYADTKEVLVRRK